MKGGASQGASLARQNAWLLVLAFVVFELMMAAVVVGFVMMPMARRSAANLSGLMVLSAQTWSELPPETRPAFERELARSHALALRAGPPRPAGDAWHGPFIHFLEAALWEKTGDRRHLVRETAGGEDWFWASLPSGGSAIWVGFPISSLDVRPFLAAAVSLAVGLVLALATALWLARRTVAPLARLEEAAAQVGRGEVPELLPETGPRELAALARRFNDMARQVRELLAARTILLAGVSHDLRTPLSRMRLALALLEERPAPRLIARMEADIGEMDRLIGNVLDLSRGLERETPQDVALLPLLESLAADDERITVGCSAVILRAAPLALRRILGNLLENALRHGAGKPVELKAEANGGRMRIGVLDRGPGIPAERVEAMFQPFHRLDASRSPTTGGAGLGLAIVRQLARANGWQVDLLPRIGGGLEAWITLPTGAAP